MLRDELAMLGNPVDDNTLALRVLSGLPAEYGMLRTVLENKDTKLVMSDVTAKLLQVEQRSIFVRASKPSGSVKSQAFAAAAPKKPVDKKSVVCFYCNEKGHMQRDCYKKKADEAKGKGKPGGGGREGGHGGGPLLAMPGAARLPGAHGGYQLGCSTLAQPTTWPPGIRASPSGRREAGPRSTWPTAIRCPSRGPTTSPWTSAKETPRRAWCSRRLCSFRT